MKMYQEYKDSGIELIGNIPKHWDILRLVNVGAFSASGIDKLSIEGQETVRMANYTDVYGNTSHELWGTYDFMVTTAPKTKVEEHNLMEGDILFTPSSETIEDIGVSAVVMENLPDVVYSYHLIRLRPFKNLDLRFRKYFCNYPGVYHQFSSVCKGTTRKILTRDNFREIRVAIPTLPEQQAIAEFLDCKTAQIDTLIEKKQRQIELLQEQRTALINQVARKGLNPNVPMKDLGVEWLGEIPSHWEVMKVKRLVDVIDGDRGKEYPNENDFVDFGIPFLSSKNIIDNRLDLTHVRYISQEKLDKLGRGKLIKGDLVITVRGTIGSVGYFSGAEYETAFINAQMMILRTQENLSSKFFYYFARSNYWLTQTDYSAYGAAQQQLSNVVLQNLSIVVPPRQEQELIENYLDQKMT